MGTRGGSGSRGSLRAVASSATLFHTQRSTLPQTLIAFVTSRCNASCDFCLYKDSVANPVRRQEELTVAEYEAIAASYGPLHYLGLSGGEPFVRPDVADICQAFVDRCGTKVIDIPSNFFYADRMVEAATLLTERNPHLMVDLQLSIDHVGERHDRSRGVAGLYEQAIETFHRLEGVRADHPNLRLKVNIVWLPRNRDDLRSIHEQLGRRIGFDRIQLTYPHELLPVEGDPDRIADLDRFIDAAGRLAADDGHKGIDLYSTPMRATKRSYHRLLRQAVDGSTPMGERCGAGRILVVLDERGEVFPCETKWESVGNVRAHALDIGAVLRGPRYAEFAERTLGPGKCNCTWSCAALSAVSVTPRLLAGLAVDTAREVARSAVTRTGH